jgi:hypothetical protein
MLKKLKGVIHMTNMKKFILTGAVVFMIGAMSVTAFAASTYKTPAEAAAGITGKTVEEVITQRQDTGKTYGEIANEAGKLEEFKNEMLEIKKDALARKVADGKLTQEQADEIIKTIEENAENCDGTGSAGTGQNYDAGFGRGNGNCSNSACTGNRTGSGRNANGQGARGGMGNRTCNGVCINQ